jgi:hypothetical protein
MITKDTIRDYFEVFIRHSREENEENSDNAHVRIVHKLTEILTEIILKAYTPTAFLTTRYLSF